MSRTKPINVHDDHLNPQLDRTLSMLEATLMMLAELTARVGALEVRCGVRPTLPENPDGSVESPPLPL